MSIITLNPNTEYETCESCELKYDVLTMRLLDEGIWLCKKCVEDMRPVIEKQNEAVNAARPEIVKIDTEKLDKSSILNLGHKKNIQFIEKGKMSKCRS